MTAALVVILVLVGSVLLIAWGAGLSRERVAASREHYDADHAVSDRVTTGDRPRWLDAAVGGQRAWYRRAYLHRGRR